MPEPARLALLTPLVDDPDAFRDELRSVFDVHPVAALLIELAPSDERAAVNRLKALASLAHAHDGAVLLIESRAAEPALDLGRIASRGGADGLHLRSPAEARRWRERLGPERSLGVGGLRTRHDAMEAGEAGADYLLFGEPRADGSLPGLDSVVERVAWWADIFQPPCMGYAPTLADVPRLTATGAEFVALGDAMWSHPGGPAAAIREAAEMLAPGEGVPA